MNKEAITQEKDKAITPAEKTKQSRRKTLNALLGTSIAGTAALTSKQWAKPLINTVTLPAHAATSSVTESATLAIMDDSGRVIADGDVVNISGTYLFTFTISPNPGAGASYPVTISINGVEVSSSNLVTAADGTVTVTYVSPGSETSGDTLTVCLELNGNPVYLCADLILVHAASDVNIKENIQQVDQQAVLNQLVNTPISYWNYSKDDATTRHIGPMAQDFSGSFSVGDSDKHIHIIDGQGVALASIQALHELVQSQSEQIELLKQQIAMLQKT